MIYKIFGQKYTPKFNLPLGGQFSKGDFIPIDLSSDNPDLKMGKTDDIQGLSDYVFDKISLAGAKCAYGGYGENRDIYQRSEYFADHSDFRSVHLGIDFWMSAGTKVCACLPGRVHSFRNNDNPGDYGPTIILEHYIGNEKIHSLYGHLSRTSLKGLCEGQLINRGQAIGTIGTPDENRDWPPHLHFQLIKNIGDHYGDYPGVCHKKDKHFYFGNCPDPIAYFKLGWGKKAAYFQS